MTLVHLRNPLSELGDTLNKLEDVADDLTLDCEDVDAVHDLALDIKEAVEHFCERLYDINLELGL